MGATEYLVESFPMKNGYPINDPTNRGGFDPQNPYLNRDPRFYSNIFYNNLTIKQEGTGAEMYTFENFVGGKDARLSSPLNSRTNYHIKKFVFMGLNWSSSTIKKAQHAKFYLRWAHLVLNFAEAANHVVGPTDAAKYGLSAKNAISYLRSRKTYDNANGFSSDPYLDEVASAGSLKFDDFIKNERRLETCFEGMRFYDLRRWTTNLAELNNAVHGIDINKIDNVTYTFSKVEVEKRNFKSAYLPIPFTEMMKMSNLVQNEGWEGWK
jgi:hypothetical protein